MKFTNNIPTGYLAPLRMNTTRQIIDESVMQTEQTEQTMRIYEVKIKHPCNHSAYYVEASDVASAVESALVRDATFGDVDPYRRVESVREFCEDDQFIRAPMSFEKHRAR